ncbi:MAG: PKD domain-containing protein [Thermoplasmata archaeon]
MARGVGWIWQGGRLRRRAVPSIVAALIATAVGAGGGASVVAYVGISAQYCPFDTGSGMELPTSGNAGNASPNAPGYSAGSVVFTASASGCVPPYSFAWNFGDGTHSTAQNVVYVYPGPGYYSGSITIRDSAGHSAVCYFCVDAHAWPTLSGGSGSSPPPCPG